MTKEWQKLFKIGKNVVGKWSTLSHMFRKCSKLFKKWSNLVKNMVKMIQNYPLGKDGKGLTALFPGSLVTLAVAPKLGKGAVAPELAKGAVAPKLGKGAISFIST